jgi:hypothetical protein
MDQKPSFPVFPMHFRGLLLLAGIYTVCWSAFYKWFGGELVNWLAMGEEIVSIPPYTIFGIFGIIVGIVLFVSAFYPVSWVWLILAGITGKIITTIWFSLGFIPDLGWNKRTIFHLVFNELVWLIPVTLIFLRSLQVKNYLNEADKNI